MYVDSLPCVRVKGGETKVHHVPVGVQSIYGWSDEGGEDRNGKEGREWRMPGLLYADGLILCSESKEDLRGMVC